MGQNQKAHARMKYRTVWQAGNKSCGHFNIQDGREPPSWICEN